MWWVGGQNYLSLVRNQGRSVSSFPDDVTHCIICFYLSRRTLLLGNRIASQHGGSMWKFRSRVSHSALYKQTSVLLMWIKRQHLLSSVYRYSFQEEIELLEAIYVHELTVKGSEERWVCPDERGFLARYKRAWGKEAKPPAPPRARKPLVMLQVDAPWEFEGDNFLLKTLQNIFSVRSFSVRILSFPSCRLWTVARCYTKHIRWRMIIWDWSI